MKPFFPGPLLLLCFLWWSSESFSQQKESFHLHLDKEIYLPGETIWFKAYTFWDNAPSAISTNLYVTVYDAGGRLIINKQYPLFDGSCNGDFVIPDTIQTKGLVLQAFTKNSLASDSMHVYNRIVPIYQSSKHSNVVATSANSTSESIQLQFFPEGGSMLAGVTNHLVVMAINQGGEPISTGVAILEAQTNTLVDSVFTDEDGVGKIQLMPLAGKTYKGVLTNQQSIQQETALPAIIQSGASLHAELSGDKIYYSVQNNADLPRLKTLQLAVVSGKDVLYKASLNLTKSNQMVSTIPTDSFPPGIISITLYDNDNNFLQAKPVLIEKKGSLPFIRIVDKNLQVKGKNSFDIVSVDTSLYNLSVSVTDALFDTEEYHSLYSEILLPESSNLLQQIFTKAVAEKNQRKIDLLLTAAQLPVSSGATPILPDDYLSVKLEYRDGNKTLPKKTSLTLIMIDKAVGKQFHTLQPNSPNSFIVTGLQFYDSAKAYFQVNEYKAFSENLRIEMGDTLHYKNFIPPVDDYLFSIQKKLGIGGNYFDNYNQNLQQSFNELQTLKSVTVKSKYVNPITKRLEELDKKYATGMFSGLARGYQLNALDDPAAERSLDAYNYIAIRIPGLLVGGPVGSRIIANSSSKGGVPILFIDESEAPAQTLETISTSRLAYVKFVPGIVIGGSFVSDAGALYVYTKKGDEPGPQPTAMKKSTLKGYDISNNFRIIDHSDTKAPPLADYRSTLYWNPYLILDKTNSKATITYYNNDVASKHLIILKGYREDGTLVEIRQIVE